MWRTFCFQAVILALAVLTNSSCAEGTDTSAIGDVEAGAGNTLGYDTASVVRLQLNHDSLRAGDSYCRRFFDAFPDTFEMFVRIYGYYEPDVETVVLGPLYGVGPEHVESLVELPCVSRRAVVGKVVRLANGGEWQADGVGYLQLALVDIVVNESELFAEAYLALGDRDRAGVMRFLVDGPHGPRPDAAAVQVLSRWPSIVRDMEAAVESLTSGTEGHRR